MLSNLSFLGTKLKLLWSHLLGSGVRRGPKLAPLGKRVLLRLGPREP